VIHNDFDYFRSLNYNKLKKRQHTWDSLVLDLKELIIKTKPDIIITPYPQIDLHLDHQYTTIALQEVLSEIKNDGESLKVMLYTNHHKYSEMYPFGAKGSIISLPPIFKKDKLKFDSIFSFRLTKRKQLDKYYSLDTMYAIRVSDYISTFYDLFKKYRTNLLNEDFSYYRRSVRDNELFFVFDRKSFQGLEFAKN
jgi:hypothetical protein